MQNATFDLETLLLTKGYARIAGVDEAGRGAWAGPLAAAAVILPTDFELRGWGLADSKKISPKKRKKLAYIIKEYAEVGIGMVSPIEIYELGLGPANRLAMSRALSKLSIKADYALVDGFRIDIKIPLEAIIKGDEKVASIAAASIIAKVERDTIMEEYANEYPEYFFEKHKGYGTSLHQDCLKKHGICAIHRTSYRPIKKFLNL